MVGETPVAQGRNSPPQSNAIKDILEDARLLGELQARLFTVDLRDFARTAVKPCLTIVAAIAVFLAALPVGLIGLAYLLVDQLAMGHPAAMDIVAALSIGLSAILGYAAMVRLRRALAVFHRSRDELRANLSCWQTRT